MNKTLLKRMAAEVSVKTLGGMIAGYAQKLEADAVTEEVIETLAEMETLIAEMKSRGNVKPEPKRSRRTNNGGESNGPVRTESGQLQRNEPGPAQTIRLGNEGIRQQF